MSTTPNFVKPIPPSQVGVPQGNVTIGQKTMSTTGAKYIESPPSVSADGKTYGGYVTMKDGNPIFVTIITAGKANGKFRGSSIQDTPDTPARQVKTITTA